MLAGAGLESLSRKRRKRRERGNTNRRDDFSFAELRTIEAPVPQTVPVAVAPKRKGSLFPSSFTNNLYQNTFATFSIKFTVKNFFPWPEIQLSTSDRDNDLSAHNRTLQMSVRVIFRSVVGVLRMREFRCELFYPFFEVPHKTPFVIIYKHAASHVRAIN